MFLNELRFRFLSTFAKELRKFVSLLRSFCSLGI